MVRGFETPSREYIYPEELLDKQRKSRYYLFLKVGNMEDILNMTIWDFWGICEAAGEQNKPGQHKQLKESQKDMIKRAKDGNTG